MPRPRKPVGVVRSLSELLAERKALLSMVVTLERALSTAGLGEEYDEMCGEARDLITASQDHDHSACSALENQ